MLACETEPISNIANESTNPKSKFNTEKINPVFSHIKNKVNWDNPEIISETVRHYSTIIDEIYVRSNDTLYASYSLKTERINDNDFNFQLIKLISKEKINNPAYIRFKK